MSRQTYTQRINNVLDFIESNLAEDLTLETLATVANFSPYHFHRIFAAIMREPLNQFIQRVRLERAAVQLLQYPDRSILEIAMDCGFSTASGFARAFKTRYNQSASTWRKQKPDDSKIGKIENKIGTIQSNPGKDSERSSSYTLLIGSDTTTLTWRKTMNNQTSVNETVTVQDLPEMTVAYVRHVGPYKGDATVFKTMIDKLMQWAAPRGILQQADVKMLAVYHDAPEITEQAKLRVSMCLTVPTDTEVEGEVGKMTLAGGKYALARFELGVDEYQQAWDTVFGEWLPQSGFEPDDRPCFEMYHNDPQTHPENKSIVDICVPVRAS
jgi:AraC family transcriptional regulator